MLSEGFVSIDIGLEFETHIDLDLLVQGITLRLIRLIASLCLQTNDGWTRRYKALIDTGNPISIIPNSIWNKAKISWLLPHKSELSGIGSGKIFGRLGEIVLILLDERTVSPTTPTIKAKAFLLDDDKVPLLLGFEDILTDIKLICDYRTKTAYLQIPSP